MIGIIHYAYGAPNTLDNVGFMFEHMLKGRPISPQMLAGIEKQYRALGTVDPLSSVSKRQAKALEQVLQPFFNEEVMVYNAYKHTTPFVEEVVLQMINDGVSMIVTLPVTPLFSKTGTGAFQEEVRHQLKKYNYNAVVIDVDDWHVHPQLVSILANRVQSAYEWLPASIRPFTKVLFTAHSQPINPEVNNFYIKQFHELATAIAEQLHLLSWSAVYRSVSNKETWLGPDVKDVIREEAARGTKGIVTCDLLAMIADIEVYFEIGQECQELCKELGLEFARTEFSNDSFDFVVALATIVKEKVALAQLM